MTILKRDSSEYKKDLGYLQAPTAQQTLEFNHRLKQYGAISRQASPVHVHQIGIQYA